MHSDDIDDNRLFEPDGEADARKAQAPIKGRGAASRPSGRFEKQVRVGQDDGWGSVYEDADALPPLATTVTEERARSIVSHNQSPDVGFDQSINPFRGCEHGCVYCFARPTHAYLDLSPGLDFETRLYAKTNAVERVREEIAKPGHRPTPIALGINTDGYQPIEKRYALTRGVLEVLAEARHPVHIVTKSALVLRDLDLLAPMAAQGLAQVHLSVTTLDNRLSARMEPRAAAPHTRIRTIAALHEAGVPVGVLVAPVIPMITDHELEAILVAARAAGAASAGYVLLRLPHELTDIWREWLQLHYPERAAHVMSLIQQMRGGKDYDSRFGTRMRGLGPFADLLRQRFAKAHRRLGFGDLPPFDETLFRRPSRQGALFELARLAGNAVPSARVASPVALALAAACARGQPVRRQARVSVLLGGHRGDHRAEQAGALGVLALVEQRRIVHQLDLARLHALAEFAQGVHAQQFAGAREHLLLLLVGVVLDELLEHLGAAAELVGIHLGRLQVRQHQVAGGAVLLHRLEEHLLVLVLFAGLAERGVEDLLLDRGVHAQLERDLAQQLDAGLAGAMGGFGELGEQAADLLVVGLEQFDGIHG